MNADLFKPLIGQQIKAVSAAAQAEITLVSVTADAAKNQGDSVHFSLIFNGPESNFLPQGMYVLIHDKLPNPSVFLSPCGKDEKGFVYQALFNNTMPRPS